MYDNLKVYGLGGFSDYAYYSSSESSAEIVKSQYFGSGGQGYSSKGSMDKVRPVRAF
jgi:hypothetical protein